MFAAYWVTVPERGADCILSVIEPYDFDVVTVPERGADCIYYEKEISHCI